MHDLSQVPLTALSGETKHLISTLLNPPKVIPTSNGLLRDWRGFAHICSIGGEFLPAIASDSDQFGCILNIILKKSQDFTLQSLKDALENLERWDIVDDSEPYLEKDAELYMNRLRSSQSTAGKNDFTAEAEILTLDDQCRIERGEQRQHYDAFVLYADEDLEFVNEIVENLEKKNKFKLCLKDRDLIAGITFEHEAVMRLISERCNRLITVLSPDFLKSPANKFFLNFAQATGIDKQEERKIIPCIYKDCEIPQQLTYFSKIYYKKLAPEYFWDKLTRSIKAVSNMSSVQKTTKSSNQTVTLNSETISGLKQDYCGVKNKMEDSLVAEASKSVGIVKSHPIFPWVKKQTTEPSKVMSQNEDTTPVDSIPSLPSLDGLDSLSSLTNSTNTVKQNKKKKKFMSNYVKKVQSLLAKS